MEDYIKGELIGGGSPRHLNTSSNLFIVATTADVLVEDQLVVAVGNWNIWTHLALRLRCYCTPVMCGKIQRNKQRNKNP